MGVLDDAGSWRRVSGRFWTLAPTDALDGRAELLDQVRAYRLVWVLASSWHLVRAWQTRRTSLRPLASSYTRLR